MVTAVCFGLGLDLGLGQYLGLMGYLGLLLDKNCKWFWAAVIWPVILFGFLARPKLAYYNCPSLLVIM
ncbi:hypothetical protein ES332_D13G146000v1 [Gossypium tomentosum]|uniref:Uncharacterized protein n=1 Tax=Gossypium tomentosum TaxID=34277 RepID=A0A5D2HWY6_GOSTO|nr:hypothetical protein ES332_D13G146000v1 [Gossypium tomentosum]